MKVIHLLYSGLPTAKGSDIRSRDILDSQIEVGLEAVAVTSPFQPPAIPGQLVEQFGRVLYYRTDRGAQSLLISERNQGLAVKFRKLLRILSFANFVRVLCDKERPQVIHAHSTFFCAAAAFFVGRLRGIPYVYEVRSLWEERTKIQFPSLVNTFVASAVRRAETLAMLHADHVVVISEGLRSEVLSRHVPEEKVSVVGNAVNLSRAPPFATAYQSKPSTKWVFGYIGNLSDIEGLDLLLDAVRRLRTKGWKNTVRFFGSGPIESQLKDRARGIAFVEFMGEFKPENAENIYQLVDVVVNPRRRSFLTEKVTPLKPLEAMAYGKLIIVSSVSGMLELVKDDVTGYVFEADDCDSLVDTLERVVCSSEKADEIVSAAYRYVADQRTWHRNGLIYKGIYEKLINGS
jgi:glycogen(starch) synthase